MSEETQMTVEQLKAAEKEKQIMKEMMPYFLYAAIPLIITIAIAITFAPSMTLP